MKKKVGGKILLCLMMCLSLFGSTLTAFATTVTNGDPNATVSGNDQTGFFSSLEAVSNQSDYIGMTSEMKEGNSLSVILRSNYLYAIVFEDNGEYYLKTEDGKRVVSSLSDITSSDYLLYNFDSYYSTTAVSFKTSFSVLVKEKENDTPKLVGTFNSWDEVPTLEIKYNIEPSVTLTYEKTSDTSAVINVDYALDDNFEKYAPNSAVATDMTLWCGDVCLESVNLLQENAPTSFTVNSNGNYKVVVSTYISSGSDEIKIDSLSEVTPEENEAKDSDSKAPIVTFSSLPDSEVTGNSVEVTMYSDEPAILNFNGVSSDDYVTEMKVTVKYNGDYTYSANDESGNMTEDVLKVSFFKDSSTDDSDRDSFWGDAIDEALPQTGSTSFKVIVAIGIVLIGGGIFFIVKSKKKNGEVNSDSAED